MLRRSAWDVPYVVCFLVGLVIVLIGLAAATFHTIDWVKTNHWHGYSDGDMIRSFGYGEDHGGWGGLQGAVDWLWDAPFWAVTLAVGVFFIYLPSLLRTLFGRPR